jgi:hypothetical protein
MTRLTWSLVRALPLALLAGCPSRDLPPPPEEPKHDPPPLCDKVFKDPSVRGGSTCCLDPSRGLLRSADIISTCGASAAAFLGETRDGTACRFHFQATGTDPKQSYVMVSRVVVPPGAPAPMGPDPMLAWTWKKIALRDAIGFQATSTVHETNLLERQTILWAGRGRRIVGLHVSKQICNEAQAQTLLQKALDAVP